MSEKTGERKYFGATVKKKLLERVIKKASQELLEFLSKDGGPAEISRTFDVRGGQVTVKISDLGDGDEVIKLDLSWSFGEHAGAVIFPVPVGDLGELD